MERSKLKQVGFTFTPIQLNCTITLDRFEHLQADKFAKTLKTEHGYSDIETVTLLDGEEVTIVMMLMTVMLFRVWAARMATFLTLSCLSRARLPSRWTFTSFSPFLCLLRESFLHCLVCYENVFSIACAILGKAAILVVRFPNPLATDFQVSWET